MENKIYLDEIWKDIKGYEHLYMASNYGRIISLNYHCKGKAKILNLSAKPNCYIKVCLRKDGKVCYFRVHRLIAATFLEPPENGQTQVDHINGLKQDNRACNLRYATPKDNANNPTTKPNNANRYHLEGEFERRSQGQKKRFQEHPQDLQKMWDGYRRWRAQQFHF